MTEFKEFKQFNVNGIPVNYLYDSSNLIFSRIFFFIGASYEPPGKRGISHLIEHTNFMKKTFNESKKNYILLDKKGVYNATTWWDYTSHYFKAKKGEFENAFKINLDIALNFSVSPSEFEKEKRVIINELNDKKQDPENLADILILKKIYGIDVDAEVIGNKEDLKKITFNDAKEWFNKYYVPKNMEFVFIGNISEGYIRKIVSINLKNLKDEGIKPKIIDTKFTPGNFEFIGKKEKKQRILRIDYPAFSIKSDNHLYQEIFAGIFGTNFSSLLYTSLTLKEGKTYSPRCDLKLTDAFNQMSIEVECSKKNLPFVKEKVSEIFENFPKNKDLEKILESSKKQLILGKLDIGSGDEDLEIERIKRDSSLQEDIEAIKKTTIDDILNVWRGFKNNEPTIIISAKD